MAEAFRIRQLALVARPLAVHVPIMQDSRDALALELLRHFDELNAEDRERIVKLVRSLSRATGLLRPELQLPASNQLLS